MDDGYLIGGRKAQPHGYAFATDAYPQMQVIAVTGGSLHVEAEASSRDVGAGWMLVLPPGARFRLSTPRSAYRGCFVCWRPERVSLPPRAVAFRADVRLRRIVEDIDAELDSRAGMQLLPLLCRLLHHRSVERIAAEPGDADAAARVDAALRANLYTDAPLAEILTGLPWSRRHLGRRYRAARGRSIKQAQLAMKLDEARRLLATGRLSVTEVALELGFPSSQHFATQFRRATGCTPSAFRARGTAGD